MREIDHPWTSPTERPVVTILDNGHIYVLSDAAADDDGAPNVDIIDRKRGQLHTSFCRSRGWLGLDGSEYVDTLTIPYFALPGHWKSVTSIRCTLGDVFNNLYFQPQFREPLSYKSNILLLHESIHLSPTIFHPHL